MPRHCRSWVEAIGAHIISRFVDREFRLADAEDRAAFMRAIAGAHERWDWLWLSYALMSSHVHYGLIAGARDPSHFFRAAHTRFANYYHDLSDRQTLGPVFADRPKLYPVERSALARLVAYHHRNPVRAGVVTLARDSRWTSHRVYLRLDPEPSWLDPEWALDAIGFVDTASGRRHFDEFVNECEPLQVQVADGADESREHSTRPAPMPLDLTALISVACEVAGVPPGPALRSRSRRAVLARRLVATIAIADLGHSYAAVAHALAVCPGSLHNLMHRSVDTDITGPLAEARARWLSANGA